MTNLENELHGTYYKEKELRRRYSATSSVNTWETNKTFFFFLIENDICLVTNPTELSCTVYFTQCIVESYLYIIRKGGQMSVTFYVSEN